MAEGDFVIIHGRYSGLCERKYRGYRNKSSGVYFRRLSIDVPSSLPTFMSSCSSDDMLLELIPHQATITFGLFFSQTGNRWRCEPVNFDS